MSKAREYFILEILPLSDVSIAAITNLHFSHASFASFRARTRALHRHADRRGESRRCCKDHQPINLNGKNRLVFKLEIES